MKNPEKLQESYQTYEKMIPLALMFSIFHFVIVSFPQYYSVYWKWLPTTQGRSILFGVAFFLLFLTIYAFFKKKTVDQELKELWVEYKKEKLEWPGDSVRKKKEKTFFRITLRQGLLFLILLTILLHSPLQDYIYKQKILEKMSIYRNQTEPIEDEYRDQEKIIITWFSSSAGLTTDLKEKEFQEKSETIEECIKKFKNLDIDESFIEIHHYYAQWMSANLAILKFLATSPDAVIMGTEHVRLAKICVETLEKYYELRSNYGKNSK